MKAKIEKLDYFGRGIARIDNKICFIEDAFPEEVVEIKIVSNQKNHCAGKVEKHIKKSKDRIPSKCKYSKICGGCCFQEFSYQKENEYKEQKVKEILERFANVSSDKIKSIEYSEENNYRNKITIHCNKNDIGLYKEETNDIIPIQECLLVDEKINELIESLRQHKIRFKEAIIRVSNDGKKSMIKLITDDGATSINNLKADVVFVNDKCITLNDKIISKIGNKNFFLSIDSFFQVNKSLTEKLYQEVLNIVKKTFPKSVLDLYCGTGTIGIYISNYVKKVVGVDVSKSAIDNANENKKLNNISNIEFRRNKVENEIVNFENKFELVIVDPPRAGLDKKTRENLKRIYPNYIIYVSCNPMTLARDLKELLDIYEVKWIKPYNMFPRTWHCEAIAVLERK